MSARSDAPPGISATLVLGVALLFLLAALAFDVRVLSLVDPDPATREWVEEVPRTRITFGVLALTAAAGGFALQRVPWLRRLAGRDGFQKLLLLLSVVGAPVALLELGLAPFVHPSVAKTTIYMRDPELGWRHRPNASDLWDGSFVRINGKGLRGPELPYEKPAAVSRVLYLGDSVTFGDGIADDAETLPYATSASLARRLGRTVETVNSGVSGYSPWQEGLYLKREGIRYQPDVVVLTFVLNDVTEKFELVRFGGSGQGWQLSHTYSSRLEQLLDHSRLALLAQRLGWRLRFGRNPKAAAQRWEGLKVESLAEAPGRDDVRQAWEATLKEVDEILDFCRQRPVPLVIVVSPFLFQFRDPGAFDAPQRVIVGHATAKGIPVLDLLPALAERIHREGRTPRDYFLDSNHYTPLGARAVAEVTADFLLGPVSGRPLGPELATR